MDPKAYPLELRLIHPIELTETKTIHSIRYRRPKSKDVKHLKLGEDKLELGDILGVFASSCDQPALIIDELDLEDAMAIAEVIGSFLESGQKTGN